MNATSTGPAPGAGPGRSRAGTPGGGSGAGGGKTERRFSGFAAAAGVAIGPVFRAVEPDIPITQSRIAAADIAAEGARLEAASARAFTAGAVSYRAVKSILDTGLDQLPIQEDPPVLHLPVTHEHVRGAAYYQTCVADDEAHDVLTLFGDPAC